MFFNSLHFVLFFCLVLPVVALLRNRIRARNVFLLVASYYFYGCWDYRFLGLIVISTVVAYGCGLWFNVRAPDIEHPPSSRKGARMVLAISVVTNLAILGFFKYYDFFITSAGDFLAEMGFQANLPTLRIILPVGISFYTFQTLSYSIDLYRGRVPTERSLLNFALYVAFFPQLVAGPIERAHRLLPQVREPRPITWPRLYSGIYLMAWGFVKKVVIADNVSLVADAVFAAESPSGLWVALGVYAFAIQIYCDFSGYTDIARGAARCMGFDLMLNFDLPYFAVNPSDFWRRWHISLSSWLRDYLYLPLGGNRKGTRRTYFNLMATMILGGLWHGAAWTFVLWGTFHGALLCVHRMMRSWLEHRVNPKGGFPAWLWFWGRVLIFFHLVCFGWLLFRADSLDQAVEMVRALFTNWSIYPAVFNFAKAQTLVACAIILAGWQLVQWRSKDLMFIFRLPTAARALLYAAGIVAFLLFGNYNGQSFIYFQF
jgi:alginate O-acetyltransferase complex protein AlgI